MEVSLAFLTTESECTELTQHFIAAIFFSVHDCYLLIIQGVPLSTEPGISLIILTPMKILQRNLNRGTFVV